MFLVWGTRVSDKIFGYFKELYQCHNCKNVSNFKVFMRRKWFTLFWIPIFPIKTEYYMCCPICNHGSALQKRDVLQMQEDNALGARQIPTSME